jgi:hypothetical protein
MSSGIIIGFLCGYNTSCFLSVVSTVLEKLAEFHDDSMSYLLLSCTVKTSKVAVNCVLLTFPLLSTVDPLLTLCITVLPSVQIC